MKLLGTLHRLSDARGEVRVEDVYATDIEDLWDACTNPERLARWLADVSGHLEPGGEFTGRFTSGWEGTGRIDICEKPHRLLVTTWEDEDPDQQSTIDARLTAVESGTRLLIIESGVPLDQVASYGAGWQIHAEDLAIHVAGGERDEDAQRWLAAVPLYRATDVLPPLTQV